MLDSALRVECARANAGAPSPRAFRVLDQGANSAKLSLAPGTPAALIITNTPAKSCCAPIRRGGAGLPRGSQEPPPEPSDRRIAQCERSGTSISCICRSSSRGAPRCLGVPMIRELHLPIHARHRAGTSKSVQAALDKLCPRLEFLPFGGDGQTLCAAKPAPGRLSSAPSGASNRWTGCASPSRWSRRRRDGAGYGDNQCFSLATSRDCRRPTWTITASCWWKRNSPMHQRRRAAETDLCRAFPQCRMHLSRAGHLPAGQKQPNRTPWRYHQLSLQRRCREPTASRHPRNRHLCQAIPQGQELDHAATRLWHDRTELLRLGLYIELDRPLIRLRRGQAVGDLLIDLPFPVRA